MASDLFDLPFEEDEPEPLTPEDQRYPGYRIENIADGVIEVAAWTGSDPNEATSFLRFHVPMDGGTFETIE